MHPKAQLLRGREAEKHTDARGTAYGKTIAVSKTRNVLESLFLLCLILSDVSKTIQNYRAVWFC